MVGARVKTIMDMCLYGCDTFLVRPSVWAVWKAEVLIASASPGLLWVIAVL